MSVEQAAEPMTVEQFIDRYYRPDRLTNVAGRRERIITDREADMAMDSVVLISRHDSVTGRVMRLFANGTVREG